MMVNASGTAILALHFGAAASYALVAWPGMAARAPKARMWVCRLAILMQTSALVAAGLPDSLADIHLGTALGCYTTLAMLILAVVDVPCRFPSSWRWLAGCAALGSVMATLPIAGHEVNQTPGLNMHFLLASLAYGMFLVALAQLVEVARLAATMPHQGIQENWAGTPLLELERLVFRNIIAGFMLLTATNVSGSILALISDGGMGVFTHHKTLFAWLSWLFVGILLVCRWRFGWRGLQALRWFIAANVALVLSYFGTVVVIDLFR